MKTDLRKRQCCITYFAKDFKDVLFISLCGAALKQHPFDRPSPIKTKILVFRRSMGDVKRKLLPNGVSGGIYLHKAAMEIPEQYVKSVKS